MKEYELERCCECGLYATDEWDGLWFCSECLEIYLDEKDS